MHEEIYLASSTIQKVDDESDGNFRAKRLSLSSDLIVMFPTTLSNLCRRPAMNTLFEIIVEGEDLENDMAAAEAALDEVARVETVLSRFDPASEVARVNRDAHQHPVLISYELIEILETCRNYWEKTVGYFDITASNEKKSKFESVKIDSAARKISFAEPGVRLDFGAFGKGYALDCAAQLLKENGVRNALLHGGTSSVLAMGNPAQVGLRNPWDVACEIESILLSNQGLSTSAVFHHDQNTSDIIDPHGHAPLRDETACVVIGATAVEAEVFSTALLCMGKTKAEKFCAENIAPHLQVLWIDNAVSEAQRVGRGTPCAPLDLQSDDRTHGVKRHTIHRLTKTL